MSVRVAVAGASGYVGGELLRLLLTHADVEIGAIAASSKAGVELGKCHPHLAPLVDQVFSDIDPDALASHDVVFLAMPHGHSAQLAEALSEDTLVIDCGADHRLTNPSDWARWYGGEYAAYWPYGLPELPGMRDALRGTYRVAVPGCYPTGATLALAPALAAGLIEPEVTIVSVSGVSGAGRTTQTQLLSADVMGAVNAYAVGGIHRHTPEITQNLSALYGGKVVVSFTPVLAPMPRGILTTASAPLRRGSDLPDPATVYGTYADFYQKEPFVCLLPSSEWPTTAATLGANSVQLQVVVDQDASRLIAVSAIDNLTKGAAGAAIQCMNIALGLPETRGLSVIGVAP